MEPDHYRKEIEKVETEIRRQKRLGLWIDKVAKVKR